MSNRLTAPTGRRRKNDGGTNANSNHKSPQSLPLGGATAGAAVSPYSKRNGHSHGGGSMSVIIGNSSSNNNHQNNTLNGHPLSSSSDDDSSAVAAHSSLLQPRLAVVLGVSRRWHPFLFLCRLCSIAPAIWWGFPSVVRLLALLHLRFFVGAGGGGGGSRDGSSIAAAASTLPGAFVATTYDWSSSEAKLRLKEAFITVIWCCAAGWVSFFQTDSLMSRALLNYTPIATLLRLSVINLGNGIITRLVLNLFSAPEDPRFAWAAWIVIATMLTLVYQITQWAINIRKETSMSMSIFSLASFASMVVLLWHLHIDRAVEYPDIPLVHLIRLACQSAEELALKIMEYGNVTGEL